LKDYLNDENGISLKAKSVAELEQVHRYYKSVLNEAKNIADYLTKLEEFMKLKGKRGSLPLAESL
jgi:hypothetical protein